MNIKNLSTEDVLTKLDQISKKGRIVSIALTAFLLAILAVIAILTYQAINELRGLNQQISDKNDQINKAQDVLSSENPCDNAKIENVKSILATSNTITAGTPKPTVAPTQTVAPKPTTAKTPIVANTPTNQTPTPGTSTPNNSKFEVYVQIPTESQRVSARELIDKVRSDKFQFPGIEFVDRKISKTQIIYFKPDDKTAAQELASKIGRKAIIVYSNLKQKSGVLEVWFSNDAFGNSADVKQAGPKKQ